MSLLLIVVVLLVLFGLPYGGYYYGNGYRQGYGYHGGGIGLILAVIVIWFLLRGHYL